MCVLVGRSVCGWYGSWLSAVLLVGELFLGVVSGGCGRVGRLEEEMAFAFCWPFWWFLGCGSGLAAWVKKDMFKG
jgi:hypothetical protein